MQEEVENRTLTLVVSGTKFTGRMFKVAIFIFVYPLWGHCYFLFTIPSMPAPQTVKSSK